MSTLLQQARFILGELGMRPHKRLGQHFLIDAAVIERMVTAADISPEDVVLEIGPGLGALSETLTKKAARLALVEMDTTLARRLTERFSNDKQVQVITADFLQLDGSAHPLLRAWRPNNLRGQLRALCLERDINFVDPTVHLSKLAAQGESPFNTVYDTHLNQAGSAAVGQLLAERMTR